MAKIVVISGIIYVGICEWKETKAREMEVRMINRKKHEINDIYVKMLRLSFFCETFMEWSEQDFLLFQKRRRHIDSLLCSLRYSSSGSHTDSIRNLWRAKERYMREIIYWVHRQEEADREIAAQIPAIARQSERENAPKGGFLKRLFAKRHKADSPSAASMLHELNRSVVGRQQAYARKLAERTDSLDGMNRRLNVQLRQVIGLTAFMVLLLIWSYMVIHRDMMRINRYKKRLEGTVRQLEQTVLENEELIEARKKIMLAVTHDLRAPLASISSYAELLSTEREVSKCREYSRNIRQVVGHMSSMLSSLLGFFRLESGREKAVSVPFRLCSVTEILETDFMPLAAGKNLLLNVLSAGDAVVIGDRDRIIQIGSNLLSNAIKFTERGSVTV
ncbi:MAG: hybrid sensor histidine kinase/response regulator, partial [Bacteroides sp.]|nr:hybrid sensor histidine kinase/response regulator [Bacteroides sp.]